MNCSLIKILRSALLVTTIELPSRDLQVLLPCKLGRYILSSPVVELINLLLYWRDEPFNAVVNEGSSECHRFGSIHIVSIRDLNTDYRESPRISNTSRTNFAVVLPRKKAKLRRKAASCGLTEIRRTTFSLLMEKTKIGYTARFELVSWAEQSDWNDCTVIPLSLRNHPQWKQTCATALNCYMSWSESLSFFT